MQHNILDIYPAAVIVAFHRNIHNHRMREEMSINKVRDVAELYALANKCARAEEGRRLPVEDAGTVVDSDDNENVPDSSNRGRKT